MIDFEIKGWNHNLSEKKEDIWLSLVTKAPTPTEKSEKQRDSIKKLPKTLITQRLQTDLGRPVGVFPWLSGDVPRLI